MVTGARALVAVGAMDDPVTAAHEAHELARVACQELVRNAGTPKREHEIRDAADARVRQMSFDRVGHDLHDCLPPQMERELADPELLGPTVIAWENEADALEELGSRRVRPASDEH